MWSKRIKEEAVSKLNEKAFRDLGYRILWDNWKQTGNERDKTRKVKV